MDYKNETVTDKPDTIATGSVVGLAVGLPLALIAVAVVVAVLWVRKVRREIICQPPEPKSAEESVHKADNPRYIAPVLRPQPSHQDPVYENFQSRGQHLPQNRQSNATSTSAHRGYSQADDLYLPVCHQEDHIYGNDPAFYKGHREPDNEDVYIIPDQ